MNTLGLNKPPRMTRVVVAMSGGVDSSTAAALMVEQGYEVVGITLQLYNQGTRFKKSGSCCAGQDVYDAKCVADILKIPHYTLDYEKKFKENVIDDFTSTYLKGETPIPCIRCNQTVKFNDLLKTAIGLKADALVTGHYVQRVEGKFGAELHRGCDDSKDQSYFLFATTREQLNFLRFPLGNLNKAETRAHAERFGLPVAEKSESQDICFVPSGSYANFVQKMRPDACKPGEVLDLDGNVLGHHDGIIGFTVGQRRGLGIAKGEPQYVVGIDPKKSKIIIGPKEALLIKKFKISNINWLGSNDIPEKKFSTSVKIRSVSTPQKSIVAIKKDFSGIITPDEPISGVAPGQACVFYDNRRILGGGWITRDGLDDKAV